MRVSHRFLPILTETPKQAEIVSHRPMLRSGLIRQPSAGIYSGLPRGANVLARIGPIVRNGQDRTVAVEMFLPTIQSVDTLDDEGRTEGYAKQMPRIERRPARSLGA